MTKDVSGRSSKHNHKELDRSKVRNKTKVRNQESATSARQTLQGGNQDLVRTKPISEPRNRIRSTTTLYNRARKERP